MRTAISDAATRLFIKRGFDNVTVAEIAEAAGVSTMTVFNHFQRKEDLFFDRKGQLIALIRTAFAKRQENESPMEVLERLSYNFLNANTGASKGITGLLERNSPECVSSRPCTRNAGWCCGESCRRAGRGRQKNDSRYGSPTDCVSVCGSMANGSDRKHPSLTPECKDSSHHPATSGSSAQSRLRCRRGNALR